MALGEFGGLFPMDAYGGAFVGRGFARRRFIGNIKATASAELRFAPLEFNLGRNKLGLGFEAFVEVGAGVAEVRRPAQALVPVRAARAAADLEPLRGVSRRGRV
jgi:hypothetical protein